VIRICNGGGVGGNFVLHDGAGQGFFGGSLGEKPGKGHEFVVVFLGGKGVADALEIHGGGGSIEINPLSVDGIEEGYGDGSLFFGGLLEILSWVSDKLLIATRTAESDFEPGVFDGRRVGGDCFTEDGAGERGGSLCAGD